MKQTICIIAVCLMLALIIGCRVAEEVEAPPESAAADVSEIEKDISDVGALDEELNLSEFEELDKELEEIAW